MAAIVDPDVPGFFAPVHRALTDPILMGGAPRTVAIANGTLAAAIALGLRLWIPGALIWMLKDFVPGAYHFLSSTTRPEAQAETTAAEPAWAGLPSRFSIGARARTVNTPKPRPASSSATPITIAKVATCSAK